MKARKIMWMKQRKKLFRKSLYPKILVQAQNGLCRTLLHGEMAETLINESEKQLPMDLLENTDTAVLNQVAKFVCCRDKKQDGSRYPPKCTY